MSPWTNSQYMYLSTTTNLHTHPPNLL